MDKFIGKIACPIKNHLLKKKYYLSLFVKYDTGPEEWFRVEILSVFDKLRSLKVESTNQRAGSTFDRPDFVITFADKKYLIELKVLPIDRNYNTGYRRFCAGKSNKADFDDLANKQRHLIIYIHWADKSDWERTKEKLEKRYSVNCICENGIVFKNNNICTISYWTKSNNRFNKHSKISCS